jgi:hypothetical protein
MNKGENMKKHIICEGDIGLFALIQQVTNHIPWALRENRIPIAFFQDRCCYWTPKGYMDKDTVWEYYFDPVVTAYPASAIPDHIKETIHECFPDPRHIGHFADNDTWVSNNFGDHPMLKKKTGALLYLLNDPDHKQRRRWSSIIKEYVHPRDYIVHKVNYFFERHMKDAFVIGVHIRGTDALQDRGIHEYRKDSMVLDNYVNAIHRILNNAPQARIFVATDDKQSLSYMTDAFGSRVMAYNSIRHEGGEAAGRGPMGCLMPAYITGDRERAARNGEEAVIEYLLLTKCHYLVHNGANLARTVLLTCPDLPHTNAYKHNIKSLLISKYYHLIHNGKHLWKTVSLTCSNLPHIFNHSKNKWISSTKMTTPELVEPHISHTLSEKNRGNDIKLFWPYNWPEGFYNFEGDSGNNWRWCSSHGTLVITNYSDKDMPYRMSAVFSTGYPEPASLKIKSTLFDDNLTINHNHFSFTRDIIIPAGIHVVEFICDAKRVFAPKDSRHLVFNVRNFKLEEIQ